MKAEKDYYEPVGKWAKRSLGCFDKGLRHGRIDVIGLRDAGGRLSGRAEVVAIEVKRGNAPFATSVGQAHGYSIYADRCYLADVRPTGFSEAESSRSAERTAGASPKSSPHRWGNRLKAFASR